MKSVLKVLLTEAKRKRSFS